MSLRVLPATLAPISAPISSRLLAERLARITLVAGVASIAIGLAMNNAQAQSNGNFQGAYVGAHLGGAFGKAQAANTSGIVGGGQIGANAQFQNNVVAGVEADASVSSMGNKGFSDKFRQGAVGSLRARGGYAMDRVMVYGTAGFAASTSEWKNAAGSTSKTLTGWAYGAGAEFLMTQNVTLRGELIRYDFGRETYLSQIGPVGVKASNNVLRGGASLKF
jgi:outer membrane immunogenic protein